MKHRKFVLHFPWSANIGLNFYRNALIFSMIAITMLTSCTRSPSIFPPGGRDSTRVYTISSNDRNAIVDAYRKSSNTSKGAVLGGVSGAVSGLIASSNPVVTAAFGTIVGASIGAYLDSSHSALSTRELAAHHVASVVLGDHVLLVVPSSALFDGLTPCLRVDAEPTLRLIADYLNHYVKTLVTVSAYTNAVGPFSMTKKLAQQQAESVVHALVLFGADARLFYPVGYGGTHFITKNALTLDGNNNYRIEITFEKLWV